jgi:hypothetical protein
MIIKVIFVIFLCLLFFCFCFSTVPVTHFGFCGILGVKIHTIHEPISSVNESSLSSRLEVFEKWEFIKQQVGSL